MVAYEMSEEKKEKYVELEDASLPVAIKAFRRKGGLSEAEVAAINVLMVVVKMRNKKMILSDASNNMWWEKYSELEGAAMVVVNDAIGRGGDLKKSEKVALELLEVLNDLWFNETSEELKEWHKKPQ